LIPPKGRQYHNQKPETLCPEKIAPGFAMRARVGGNTNLDHVDQH
jgi:hypothetical protein